MTDLFTSPRDVTSCPLTKQTRLTKSSNGKLRTLTLVNVRALRRVADFASALSNVKMLIMLKILRSLSDCVSCNDVAFFSLFSPKNHVRRRRALLESCEIMKTSIGEFLFDNLKQFLAEVSFYFHLQLSPAKTYLNG